ncbi:Uncharacterized conserved protein, DUF305 family [Actinopolyspora xinjiangensis]|uniref:Uncharacterized conserved protein, DUF305 family n=1 Tax=Actinopolyspora xinjiangensis TaxID=405564 RepID=A0A1H0W250_9ACTN|nr:DUF305 domain-containing protein [Actinopolyspora xinjiangensis]SDP84810.1 Uncharacterized conserved protein, DUF305 family [Actinopolyspora xinjiangensis]
MRKSTIIGVLGAAVLALTGCSPNYEQPSDMEPGPGTPPPPSAIVPAEDSGNGDETARVDTDLEFAQQMVAHHEAERQLLEVAIKNAPDERVVELAERLEQEHGPRIEEISAWLRERGEGEVSPEDVGTGEDSQMPGTDVASEITKLEEAQQGRFDSLWVKSMVDYYEAIVEMCRTEIDKGSDEEMKSIARQLLDSRVPTLEELRQLQRSL